MNLSVKDVAGLLKVSDKTIYRMIQNETIPCFRVGGQWRFDRREIMSWMEDTRAFSYKTAAENNASDEESISIAEFLLRGGIYQAICAVTKEDAVKLSLMRIKTQIAGIDIKKLFASIMDREALCPTSVGNGIALPHPGSIGKFTVSSHIALCRLERPIPFGSVDNEDVDTLFFIFPKSERRFLRIQAKLLRLLRDEEVISAIKRLQSSEELYRSEILRVLTQKETQIFSRAAV
jgi:PTS system nitrogen regulatory IIA component